MVNSLRALEPDFNDTYLLLVDRIFNVVQLQSVEVSVNHVVFEELAFSVLPLELSLGFEDEIDSIHFVLVRQAVCDRDNSYHLVTEVFH